VRPPRPRNPILPGTTRERTGTGPIIRRAVAQINVRFAALTAEVLAAFDRIPVYARNEAAVLYGMTPEQMAQLSGELQASLDAYIARNGEDVYRFWWSPYVSDAYQLGSAQAAANLAGLSPAYAAGRSLQSIMYSEPYRNRVGIAQTKSYDHWSGQSAQIRAELSQIIGSAIADGRAPREVRALIRARLDVSASKARAFAQTDITDSLRQARWAEDDAATEELGLDLRELHTSALLPTTRHTHAARHGKVYTTQEMRDWYAKDGNRYNCHCSSTTCLIDASGKPILTDGLKKKMAKELKDWKPAMPS
jgi:hypothetical protein